MFVSRVVPVGVLCPFVFTNIISYTMLGASLAPVMVILTGSTLGLPETFPSSPHNGTGTVPQEKATVPGSSLRFRVTMEFSPKNLSPPASAAGFFQNKAWTA
jgi:hypothetical protein